jgi:hypothetical protein
MPKVDLVKVEKALWVLDEEVAITVHKIVYELILARKVVEAAIEVDKWNDGESVVTPSYGFIGTPIRTGALEREHLVTIRKDLREALKEYDEVVNG